MYTEDLAIQRVRAQFWRVPDYQVVNKTRNGTEWNGTEWKK